MITGVLGIHILPTNSAATKNDLRHHQPSWIMAAVSFFIKQISKITNWNQASDQLILTRPEALKQASEPPDCDGHSIPMTWPQLTNHVPIYIVAKAIKIHHNWKKT